MTQGAASKIYLFALATQHVLCFEIYLFSYG